MFGLHNHAAKIQTDNSQDQQLKTSKKNDHHHQRCPSRDGFIQKVTDQINEFNRSYVLVKTYEYEARKKIEGICNQAVEVKSFLMILFFTH